MKNINVDVDLNWFENDELFFNELHKGRQYELYIGLLLMNEGFAVKCSPKRDSVKRKTIHDRHKFKDQKDLLVGSFNKKPILFEVKSRNLNFTSPIDYPFETAIVSTVNSWKIRKEKPHIILLVSQKTKKIIGINRTSFDKWSINENQRDNVRNITDPSYLCHRDYFISWDKIINWLHNIYKVEEVKEN